MLPWIYSIILPLQCNHPGCQLAVDVVPVSHSEGHFPDGTRVFPSVMGAMCVTSCIIDLFWIHTEQTQEDFTTVKHQSHWFFHSDDYTQHANQDIQFSSLGVLLGRCPPDTTAFSVVELVVGFWLCYSYLLNARQTNVQYNIWLTVSTYYCQIWAVGVVYPCVLVYNLVNGGSGRGKWLWQAMNQVFKLWYLSHNMKLH